MAMGGGVADPGGGAANRTCCAILAVAVLAVGVGARPGRAGAAQRIKLTMPAASIAMSPVYLAKGRGYFEEEDLDVEIVATPGGGPDIMALIAGEADFTFTPGDNALLAQQQGRKVKMVMSGLNRLIINWAIHRDVARAKGIAEDTPLPEKLKALKGLTVGVTQLGALTAHLATFVVRKAGYVPHQDVKLVPVGSGPTWLAALANRKVDVALAAAPILDAAIYRGYASMFLNNAKGEDPSLPEFLMEDLLARPETIAQHPGLVRKMVRAIVKANAWAVKHSPEEVADALRPFLSNTDFVLLLAGVRSTLPAFTPDGRISERSVQVTQDVLQQAGLLQRRVPFAEAATNDFLPN